MDYELGRLVDCLDKRDGPGSTLVFFTSDNGPETLLRYAGAARSYGSPGPHRSMKLSLYEGGIRVPGVVRWPGRVKAGQTSLEPISNFDLLPTLAEAAGVSPPARKLDGTSLLQAWSGRPLHRASPLHWHYVNALDRPRAALRDGNWKVLGIPEKPTERSPGAGFRVEQMEAIKSMKLSEFELYNLRMDPGEKNNLAQAEPRRLARMREQLVRLHEEVQREAPVWS
jgi:arylsulfatase A